MTQTPREVHQPYREACQDYVIGFATAFLGAATVCGYGFLWNNLSGFSHRTIEGFFVAFSLAGFASVGIAYTAPIWFYELLEGEPEPDD